MGSTPLPPFTDKIFGKKGVTDLGGTPPPPLYGQNPQSSIWCPPLETMFRGVWHANTQTKIHKYSLYTNTVNGGHMAIVNLALDIDSLKSPEVTLWRDSGTAMFIHNVHWMVYDGVLFSEDDFYQRCSSLHQNSTPLNGVLILQGIIWD